MNLDEFGKNKLANTRAGIWRLGYRARLPTKKKLSISSYFIIILINRITHR